MPATPTEPADSELLDRFVRQRDEGAFRSLVGRYQPMVAGAALRRTGDVEMARDVAQRVFVTLARKADRLVEHARLGGWLYRTSSFEASRAMQSETRRRRREQIAADAQMDPDSESANWEALEDSLAAMPRAGRELVVMHYFDDLSYAEMAAQLDLTEVATRKRMSRTLADLGQRLARSGVRAPAGKLLISAVAMQAALPVENGIAATALTATSNSSLLPMLMTSTTAKTCAAVIALAAVPLSLQWTEYRAVANEVEQTRLLDAPAAVPYSTGDSALPTLRQQIADAQLQLGELEAARKAVGTRKGELERTLETLGNEFVLSHGNIDAIASGCAKLILEMAKIENPRYGGTEEDYEKHMNSLLASVMQMMPTVLAIGSLDERPELNARFYGAVIGDALELDEGGRKQIAATLFPEMLRLQSEGLVISKRPPAPDVAIGESEWDLRYIEAVGAYAKVLEPLMPKEALQSSLWPMFAEGEIAMMLLTVAGPESPFAGSSAVPPTPPKD